MQNVMCNRHFGVSSVVLFVELLNNDITWLTQQYSAEVHEPTPVDFLRSRRQRLLRSGCSSLPGNPTSYPPIR